MRPWQNKTGGSVMAKQDQIRTFLSVTVDLKKQVPYQETVKCLLEFLEEVCVSGGAGHGCPCLCTDGHRKDGESISADR